MDTIPTVPGGPGLTGLAHYGVAAIDPDDASRIAGGHGSSAAAHDIGAALGVTVGGVIRLFRGQAQRGASFTVSGSLMWTT